MKKLSELQELAEDLVEQDSERDKMFRGMDDMVNLVWDLPQTMQVMNWLRIVKSTDPYDQIRGGTRVLSTKRETVEINPYSDNPETQKNANKLERVLKSNMFNATRRRGVNIVSDMTMSALMYSEICLQVLYLPWQEKIAKTYGIKSNRLEAMKRLGPFVLIPHKPETVHTAYSNYMMEGVLSITETTPTKLQQFWGGLVPTKITSDDKVETVYCFDYWDYDQRTVWCSLSPDVYNVEEDMQIINEPMDLPFIPWVSVWDGTTLQGDSSNQRLPLLYAAYQAKQWQTQNIASTIVLSEAIAHMAAPRVKYGGPGAENITVEYGNPEGAVVLGPGQTAEPLAPPTLDQGMMEMANQQRQAISRSGISDTLLGAPVGSNVSYSAYSLNVQGSMSVIKPFQTLVERAYSEAYMISAQWVHHSKDELTGLGMDKDDKGKLYTISYKDFEPDKLMINVTLNPDIAVDQQQKVNTAVMAVERLGMSKEAGLASIGEEDPQGMLRDKMFEVLQDTFLQKDVKKEMTQVDIEAHIAEQAAVMQLQQAQQRSMQPQPGGQMGQPPPMQQPYPQIPNPGTPPGMPEQAGGMGNNPAEGGAPAILNAPGTTRESQTGKTRMQ